MTTALSVLQAITVSWALVLVLVLIGRWPPPKQGQRAHSVWWRPEHDAWLAATPLDAPTPWQRVGA